MDIDSQSDSSSSFEVLEHEGISVTTDLELTTPNSATGLKSPTPFNGNECLNDRRYSISSQSYENPTDSLHVVHRSIKFTKTLLRNAKRQRREFKRLLSQTAHCLHNSAKGASRNRIRSREESIVFKLVNLMIEVKIRHFQRTVIAGLVGVVLSFCLLFVYSYILESFRSSQLDKLSNITTVERAKKNIRRSNERIFEYFMHKTYEEMRRYAADLELCKAGINTLEREVKNAGSQITELQFSQTIAHGKCRNEIFQLEQKTTANIETEKLKQRVLNCAKLVQELLADVSISKNNHQLAHIVWGSICIVIVVTLFVEKK